MRRLRFVLAVLIALAAGRGQAQVEGVLTGRLEWAGEVEVAADVWVAPGAELVVRPGTRVRFAEAPSTKTDPLFWQPGTELAVGGVLRVEGTPDAPVVFEGPAWGGLVAAPGSAVTLRHAVVRGAE
ncbi:MAG: right-handed parallel beta-helix repeat-containing protein, partial [Candidatus Dadabacteria bacterium]